MVDGAGEGGAAGRLRREAKACRRTGVSDTILYHGNAQLPLVFRWRRPDNPLPLRRVSVPRHGRRRTIGLEAPGWLAPGPLDQPFDFSGHIPRLGPDPVG